MLSRIERAAFRLGDLSARRLHRLASVWNSTALVALTALMLRRRLRYGGLEHVHALARDRGTIFVANHRSFFDYFAVECILFAHTDVRRRLLFPVRSTFFYDHPLGIALNMATSGVTMFPPIFRERGKQIFNRYALERCIAELEENRVVLGLHPEGTRSRDPDPFAVGPARPGVGRILVRSTTSQVLPVFITGLSNSFARELRRNWREPAAHPIYVVFGAPIALGDLRARGCTRHTEREAVVRCMDAIRALAEATRKAAEGRRAGAPGGATPAPA